MSGRIRKSRSDLDEGLNMTPMIDIVFQMIIFFVLTIDLDQKRFDENIQLAMAPHAEPVDRQHPSTVFVDVNKDGVVSIGLIPMNDATLLQYMRARVAEYGNEIPVVIRGDEAVKHADIRRAME